MKHDLPLTQDLLCEGWHFTHLWKTLLWPHHSSRRSFVPIKLMLCKCMIGVSMLPVSTIILFDFRIVPTMCYFLFFISLYIILPFLNFLMNDEVIKVFSTSEWNVNPHIISLELEGGHVSSLVPVFLIQAFVLIFSFVFMLYLYYLLFSLWMLVLKFNLYSVSYCSLREWYLNLVFCIYFGIYWFSLRLVDDETKFRYRSCTLQSETKYMYSSLRLQSEKKFK
jgi:hypothetical protein